MRAPEAIRLLLRIGCFLPLMAVLVVIDWISVRPAVRRIAERDLNAAAAAMLSGRTIWSDAEMRDIKAAYLEKMPHLKDMLVLGSSRLLPVSDAWFPTDSMFNAGVLTGDLDDEVAMFQVCVESGKMPHTVLLELNPSLVREEKRRVVPYLWNAWLRYQTFPPRFFGGLAVLEGVRWDFHSLESTGWGTAERLAPGFYFLRPDGSSDLSDPRSKDTPEEIEAKALAGLSHLDAFDLRWRTSSTVSGINLKILRRFLDDLRSRGIRVVVVLPPVHPAVYDFYTSRGGYNETWIRREMSARGIQVVGSFSPSAAKATRADFIDGVHPRGELLRRLLSEAGIATAAGPNL